MVTEEKSHEYDNHERLRDRRRQKKEKVNYTIIVVVCILVFLTVLAASVILYLWVDKRLQRNVEEVIAVDEETTQEAMITYSQEEVERLQKQAYQEGADDVLRNLADGINSSSSLVTALRPLYKDELVVASEGAYHFVPIDYNLKMHPYTEDNLRILDNGFVEYVEGEKVISHKGIDVSKHQGEIDWAKVAGDGVEFAFIRVGNRGYGSGAIVEDAQFDANVVGAISNGIKVGVYFFTQAITEEEAREEANFVLQKIAPYNITCPVVIDVEKVDDSEARMNKISKEERTANTLAFLETIEAAGYEAMLYHNMEMAALKLDIAQLEGYEKWFAYYNKEMYYPYEYTVWQYSDRGRVNGISGDVDLNISFHLWDD